MDHQDSSSELGDNIRVKVKEALLKKHHHQIEKKRNNLIPMVRSFAEVGKKQSEPHLLDKNSKFVFTCCVHKVTGALKWTGAIFIPIVSSSFTLPNKTGLFFVLSWGMYH